MKRQNLEDEGDSSLAELGTRPSSGARAARWKLPAVHSWKDKRALLRAGAWESQHLWQSSLVVLASSTSAGFFPPSAASVPVMELWKDLGWKRPLQVIQSNHPAVSRGT